jgi:hypothetical protein
LLGVGGVAGSGEPSQISLDVGDEHGHTGRRELARKAVQSLRFARPGSAGNETVAIQDDSATDTYGRSRTSSPKIAELAEQLEATGMQVLNDGSHVRWRQCDSMAP